MKFRPHRGSLADSMAEVVHLPASKQSIADYVNALYNFGPDIGRENIVVQYQGRDERTGWDTYLVSANVPGLGVIGFTDENPL